MPLERTGAVSGQRPKASPALLRTLFLHHDGIVLGPTVAALRGQGVLDALLADGRRSVGDLLNTFPLSPGYLHVALRCLALQGWLQREGTPGDASMIYAVTDAGRAVETAFPLYAQVAETVYRDYPLAPLLFADGRDGDAGFDPFAGLVARCTTGWELGGALHDNAPGSAGESVRRHLDGMLAAPVMITLAMEDAFDDSGGIRVDDIPWRTPALEVVLRLLLHLGWIEHGGTGLTALGREARDYSLHYGLTWSYYPMMRRLPQLLARASSNVTHVERGRDETHVDRVLNVLASGVAHRPYFEDADRLVMELFDREPIEHQPRFVADMGCGDAAWLVRIYDVVRRRTLRGRHLDTHPLVMVAADYNAKALDVARRRLETAGVPHLILFGDIADPAGFSAALAEHGLAMEDGLHIRAFIDHNRPYAAPDDTQAAASRRVRSTGAFAEPGGDAVPNALLEQNLVEHLRRWAPFVKRHGLVILEAHDVEPRIARRHLGHTHAVAFDTYHGYSNQYPVDYEAFVQAAEEAGLRPVIYQQRIYPSRLPFVAISLNRFLPKNGAPALTAAAKAAQRSSGDNEDGEAMHLFVYTDGDLTRPARWCAPALGATVEAALTEIAARLHGKRAGETLRVVEYGTKTGFASIELIKGLYESGMFVRMQRQSVDFRLELADFPSPWYDQARTLLGDMPFVHFHSLRDPSGGRILTLADLFSAGAADLVMATLTMHLVPPRALRRVAEGFAHALPVEGVLLWVSPDIAPAPGEAAVFHTPNRRLRELLLRALDQPSSLDDILERVPEGGRERYRDIPGRLREVAARLAPDARDAAAARAERQILPRPNSESEIVEALAPWFDSEIVHRVSLMRDEDALTAMLVPANQRYIAEIDDPDLRHRTIELLMRFEVMPEMRAGPAGHPEGYALHWACGRHVRRPS